MIWRRPRREPYLRVRFGISQRHPERAFEGLSRTMKSRGEALSGSYWTYDEERRDNERTVVAVRRCLFNDFLRANGAPALTSLFCALDWVGRGARRFPLRDPFRPGDHARRGRPRLPLPVRQSERPGRSQEMKP
jgi:hypothetical protein